MATPDHVSTETLADHAEGLLRESDAATVNAHLDACADCRAEALLLASLADLLAGDDPGPMPAHYAARIDLALAEAAKAYPVGSGAPPPPLDLTPAATEVGGAEIIDLAERRKVVAQGLSRVTTVAASIVLLIGGTVLGMQALNSGAPDAPDAPVAIGTQDADAAGPDGGPSVQPSPFRAIKNPAVEIDPKGRGNADDSWTNRSGTVILPSGDAVLPNDTVIPAPKGKTKPAKDPAGVPGPLVDSRGDGPVTTARKASPAPKATAPPADGTAASPAPEPEPTKAAGGAPGPVETPALGSKTDGPGGDQPKTAVGIARADAPAYVEDTRSAYTPRNFARKVRTLLEKARYRESSLGAPVPDAEPAAPTAATDPAATDPAAIDPAATDPAATDPAAPAEPAEASFREASVEAPGPAAADGPANAQVKDRVERCAAQLGGRAVAGDTGTWRGLPVTIVVVPDPANERQVIARAVSGPCTEERPASDPGNVRHMQFVYLRP